MRIWNPEWTDSCVVIGPNKRWAEQDTLDMFQWWPEKLLGYRIYVYSAHEAGRALRGMRPSKVIVLSPGQWTDRNWLEVSSQILLLQNLGSKVEYLHRLTPPQFP